MSDDSHKYDEEVFTTICEVHESLVLGDPLYKKGFEAGAASRDAEITELVAALEKYVNRQSMEDLEYAGYAAEAALAKVRKPK